MLLFSGNVEYFECFWNVLASFNRGLYAPKALNMFNITVKRSILLRMIQDTFSISNVSAEIRTILKNVLSVVMLILLLGNT